MWTLAPFIKSLNGRLSPWLRTNVRVLSQQRRWVQRLHHGVADVSHVNTCTQPWPRLCTCKNILIYPLNWKEFLFLKGFSVEMEGEQQCLCSQARYRRQYALCLLSAKHSIHQGRKEFPSLGLREETSLSPCGEIRGGSSAVPWCMKPLSHSSTPRINASSLLLQSPCNRGQTHPEKTGRARGKKDWFSAERVWTKHIAWLQRARVPSEACRNTHQPLCPPHACDIHHWFYGGCNIRFPSLLSS